MPKRKVYSADVKVWATLYVVASSAKEARRMMREQIGGYLGAEGEQFFGDGFDSPDMPDVSFSPAMTVAEPGRLHGFAFVQEREVETNDGEG